MDPDQGDGETSTKWNPSVANTYSPQGRLGHIDRLVMDSKSYFGESNRENLKSSGVTMNFHTSLITFDGTRHNWKDLVSPVETVLARKASPKVNVLSGDRHVLSEITALEVFLYQSYIGLLGVHWKRHITQFSKNNQAAAQRFLSFIAECISAVWTGAISAFRRPQTLRKRALRVLNISELHFQAVLNGLRSEAKWVMTLEDDGLLSARSPLSSALDFILESGPPEVSTFFDISDSFSFEQLGVEQIVATSDHVRLGSTGQNVVKARVPFTNTLCATVMSRAFALKWAAYLEKNLSSKVLRLIPIDWHLNRFILRASKGEPSAYFHFDPGIIRQGSIG